MAPERLGHSADTWAIRFVHLRHKTAVSQRQQDSREEVPSLVQGHSGSTLKYR